MYVFVEEDMRRYFIAVSYKLVHRWFSWSAQLQSRIYFNFSAAHIQLSMYMYMDTYMIDSNRSATREALINLL